MTRNLLIQTLVDDLPVTAGEVTAAVAMASTSIEAMLRSAGAEPAGSRGVARLWRADDVLVEIFRVEPAEFRARRRAAEAA